MKLYFPTETFLSIRRWIGLAGVLLPIVTVAIAHGMRPSLSDFYYTEARNWFVGSLFTIGAFLCSYYGYDQVDRVMSIMAGVCAFGVALFPADSGPPTIVGYVHYGFAGSLFIILAWFALFQFTKSSSPNPTPNKILRNKFYRCCGFLMLASLAALFVSHFSGDRLARWNLTYWLETICLLAFGVSWGVKGEFILKDR